MQQFDSSDNEVTLRKFGYDAAGQQIWSAYKTGTYTSGGTHNTYAITTNTFDDLGRLMGVLFPDPDDPMYLAGEGSGTYSNATGDGRASLSYTYDLNGNQVTSVNELGETTTNAFDDLNRLISRTDPDPDNGGSLTSPVTNYTYDTLGRMLTLDDPESNMTTWTYDTWDNVLTETNELNKTRTMTYDLRNLQLTLTNRNNRIITSTYDLLGRLTLQEFTTTTNSTVTQAQSYEYDLNSRLTRAKGYFPGTPPSVYSDYIYTYSDTGWLTSQQVQQTTFLLSTLTNTYNEAGQRSRQNATYSNNSGFTVTRLDYQNDYTYDGAGRLKTLKQANTGSGGNHNTLASKFVEFAYNHLDQLTDLNRYANTSATNLVVHTDYDRDYLGRVVLIDHFKGSTHFTQFELDWDQGNRIEAIDDVFSNSAWNETHDFTYDDTDQLTDADHSVQSDESYTYDENGNRNGSQTHLGGTATSTVGSNNQITSDGTYTYAYDDEGNLVSKTAADGSGEAYIWDHMNRLNRVKYISSTATGNADYQDVYYRYDHNNQLIRRQFDNDGTGANGMVTTDVYVYDGVQIVLHFMRGPGGSANLKDRYLWGASTDHLLANEQVTSQTSAGTVYWPFEDQINTAHDFATYNAGTDTTTVAKHRSFDSFGNIISDTAAGIVMQFGFTSRYVDTLTKLQNHWWRWYITSLAVWMSEDPAKDGVNWRIYVENQPTYATDPTGLLRITRQNTARGDADIDPTLPDMRIGARYHFDWEPGDTQLIQLVESQGEFSVTIQEADGTENTYSVRFVEKYVEAWNMLARNRRTGNVRVTDEHRSGPTLPASYVQDKLGGFFSAEGDKLWFRPKGGARKKVCAWTFEHTANFDLRVAPVTVLGDFDVSDVFWTVFDGSLPPGESKLYQDGHLYPGKSGPGGRDGDGRVLDPTAPPDALWAQWPPAGATSRFTSTDQWSMSWSDGERRSTRRYDGGYRRAM